MQQLTIRADFIRLITFAGICFAFVVIGVLMFVSGSRAINAGDVFWECVVALIVIIFFGGGGLFLLYTNLKVNPYYLVLNHAMRKNQRILDVQ